MKNIARKDGVEARLIGKMEAYQPLCSVKERSALRCVHSPNCYKAVSAQSLSFTSSISAVMFWRAFFLSAEWLKMQRKGA
jgi:hypothetical protein